jgi:sulfate transport system permease protein
MSQADPLALPTAARAAEHLTGARRPTAEPALVRWLLIAAATLYLGLFLVLPLLAVVAQALQHGVAGYLAAVTEPAARDAIRLTLLTAAIVVPLNTLFGLAAAWAIARFRFPGRGLLRAAIPLPLAVSPVIAGLIYVLLLGARGPLGPWLADRGWQVIFAPPGVVIATLFVTLPLVASELLPLLEALGAEEEEAAVLLGASGWAVFWRVTLPNIKWGLLNGLILCNARAMGEFGAVSVVSGHVRGLTNTIPLHVEVLYNEYRFTDAFAVASLLTLLALVTLLVKHLAGEHAVAERDAPRAGREAP